MRHAFDGVPLRTLVLGLIGACTLSIMMSTEVVMAGEQARTVCVGHFLLDVPKDASVRATGSYRAVTVEKLGSTDDFEEIETEARRKAASLEGQKTERKPDDDDFDRGFGIDPTTTFSATRLVGVDVDPSRQQTVVGRHVANGSAAIEVVLTRLLAGAKYAFSVQGGGADKYSAIRESLARTVDRYTPLRPNEIPTQPGFCVGDGVFQEDGPQDVGGDATLIVHFLQHPNVTFSVDVAGLMQPSEEPSLEGRISGDLGMLARFSSQVKTLQRGKVRYAGQDGYEIAISAPSEGMDGTRMQKFFFGAEGIPRDARHPFMEVQLMTGETGPSPLTDEQAKVLWQELMGSLRLRPGSM